MHSPRSPATTVTAAIATAATIASAAAVVIAIAHKISPMHAGGDLLTTSQRSGL